MSANEETIRKIRALDPPRTREELAVAAVEAASSDDPECLAALRDRLHSAGFLRRLDDVQNPSLKTLYLKRVFSALGSHPSEATRELCLAVAGSPAFLSEPIRMNYLLPALAAVRPMTESAAELMRRFNPEGYYNVNAPILMRNGSPAALRLFEEMIRDSMVDPPTRIDALHTSLLPYRTELAVLQMCSRLLQGELEPEVHVGVVETLFDYQAGSWFGVVRVAPAPRPWETASNEALRLALTLAEGEIQSAHLPRQTREAIERSAEEIRGILSPNPR